MGVELVLELISCLQGLTHLMVETQVGSVKWGL